MLKRYICAAEVYVYKAGRVRQFVIPTLVSPHPISCNVYSLENTHSEDRTMMARTLPRSPTTPTGTISTPSHQYTKPLKKSVI